MRPRTACISVPALVHASSFRASRSRKCRSSCPRTLWRGPVRRLLLCARTALAMLAACRRADTPSACPRGVPAQARGSSIRAT
eukprot:2559098-Alexandrium_andersonii.AAC.1